MNIRIETVNKISVEHDAINKVLDEASERLEQEMKTKLQTIANVFQVGETVVVTIDHEKSKASISVENIPNNRIGIVRDAINSLA